MLKFKFFNKDKSDEVNVKIESDNDSMEKIATKADIDCIERYNQSVADSIKEKLILQYKIGHNIHMGMMAFYEEKCLVDAICKDIAKEMNLLKEVK